MVQTQIPAGRDPRMLDVRVYLDGAIASVRAGQCWGLLAIGYLKKKRLISNAFNSVIISGFVSAWQEVLKYNT